LNARGTHSNRIKFTKLNDNHLSQRRNNAAKSTLLLNNDNTFRLVEGESVFDGKLQIFYKAKWHYVCSTHFK